MPTEVRFPDNNEAKHIKLVLVGHFCPGSSHLKVCVAESPEENRLLFHPRGSYSDDVTHESGKHAALIKAS